MNNLTEQQLLKQYLAGDQRSLEVLINQHKDKIFTSIYLLVKDRSLAEDIFQDTFIKVIDRLKNGKYNDEGKFVFWVTRIAHNLCIDHFRKSKTMSFIKKPEDRDIFESMDLMDDCPNHIEQRQTHDRVRRLLDKLPEDQREVIILRHYADMSFAEIAKTTKCSINTALGRMRYGLLNLRKLVREKELAL